MRELELFAALASGDEIMLPIRGITLTGCRVIAIKKESGGRSVGYNVEYVHPGCGRREDYIRLQP